MKFLHTGHSGADAVVVYARSKELIRLQSHLTLQLREGARVVTVDSDFPDGSR
jgi:hypothetical protein